jgi:hypothetical protein
MHLTLSTSHEFLGIFVWEPWFVTANCLFYIFFVSPCFCFYLSFVSLCLVRCFCMWTYSFSFGFLLHLTVFCTDINMNLDSTMQLQDLGMWSHWRTSCWMKLRKLVRQSSKLIEAGEFQRASGQGTMLCNIVLYPGI